MLGSGEVVVEQRSRSSMARLSRRLLVATALACGLAFAGPARAEVEGLEIIAPANPGGGWDQTARAMQSALQEAGLASGVQVVNVGGAGGTIGLAQFVTSKKRKGDAILVGGLVMEGAILTNKSPVSLEDVTPLARLTGEYELIVVPAESPIQTMADLVEQMKSDPGAVAWGGGSTGGTDHILAGLIAKAAGVDPTKVNYIAHSGGGEALGSILGGHVTVGVSGYEEFVPQVQAGKLRALAISSDERLPGIDVPTLKEQGIEVSLVNWRGVFAPPQVRDKDKEALSEAIAQMVASPAWKDTLQKRGWLDMYQPADAFAAFLEEDQAKIETTLKEIGLVQ
jgi:putative tricarboxylic transport membrane protein